MSDTATEHPVEFTPYGTPEPGPLYLEPTEFFDFDHPAVGAFAEEALDGAEGEIARAVALYYAVRDRIRYDPYRIRLDRRTYRASNLIAEGAGFCIPKANLLVACARHAGIAAAIGLADVTNHLSTERLKRRLGGTDLFLHHGYAVLHLDGQWVKAAPAFNIELCKRFDVRPTEFDGESPALFQEYDAKGRRHMEYVRDHGIWSDFPYERVVAEFAAFYPPGAFDDGSRGRAEAARFEDERKLA